MSLVKFETPDSKRLINLHKEAQIDFLDARKSSLSSIGFFLSGTIQNFILSNGRGRWRNLHPLSVVYGGIGEELRARPRKQRNPFGSLYRFSRYKVQSNKVATGFALEKIPSSFSPTIEKRVAELQAGYSIPVSEKMRRFLAASTEKQGRKTGETFFPLRKSTRSLIVPKRPIERPVFAEVSGKIFPLFEQKIRASLKRKNELFEDF